MGKRFRSFPSPSSPSHQFLLETENKIDFKGATPDLFFSQNCSNNLHFGMERVGLIGRGGWGLGRGLGWGFGGGWEGWVGTWGMSIERSQLQSNESCKPLAKNLIRPEGRGGNYI